MKKSLLTLILFIGCQKNENKIEKIIEDSVRTESVLKEADSALQHHNKVNKENLKVLNEIIKNLSDSINP